MAKETVDAVRQAELNAADTEKDAVAKSEAIIQKAQQDAKALILNLTKEVSATAASELEKAQEKNAQVMAEALQRAEKEVLFLKEMVKSKEKGVLDIIISEVI